MKLFSLVQLVVFGTLSCLAGSQATSPGLQLQSLSWSGPGCPTGTVSFAESRAGDDALILFSAFTTRLPDSGTKDCALSFRLGGIPEGQQVVFNNVTARGFLSLAAESQANYRATGFWSSDAAGTIFAFKKEYTGEMTDNAFQLGPLELSDADKKKYASVCTGPGSGGQDTFNLNMAVMLTGAGALAEIDNLDVGFGFSPC